MCSLFLILGHATAADLMKHFTELEDQGLPMTTLIQIGMDGPNVNWKFYSDAKAKLVQEYDNQLINLGSCGLHTIHNAFKHGAEATEWKVSSFLSSIYYLFKDSPARREDFVKVTGSSKMPLKFVNHRWLENVPVCERSLMILDDIKKYVKAVVEKKISTPGCKSYTVVSDVCANNKLIIPKLQFFKSIAMILQPFLAKYQTSKPMVSFLYDDLLDIIKTLLRRICKPEVLQEKNADELVRLDVEDKKLHVGIKKVEIGFSCENALKQCKNVSEREVLDFRNECKLFIVAVIKKILLKSPTQYPVVSYLACLNPKQMFSNADKCVAKLKKLLRFLLNLKKNDWDVLNESSELLHTNLAIIFSVWYRKVQRL